MVAGVLSVGGLSQFNSSVANSFLIHTLVLRIVDDGVLLRA